MGEGVAQVNSLHPHPTPGVPRFIFLGTCQITRFCLKHFSFLSLISLCVDFKGRVTLSGKTFLENLPNYCFRDSLSPMK